MSGDYSRIAYDPLHDYSAVLLQQGRPLTDRDWNDFAQQESRLQQVTRYDTFVGKAVVPLTTPDGFALKLANSKLTIGRGRIYVDGLLAENHGDASSSDWDAALAEAYGVGPLDYLQQPYLPNAKPLPTSGGPYAVYIDVWEREVTALTAPELMELALGVDTTTRLQTVWQVKWLDNSKNVSLSCDTDPAKIPGWQDLIAPSAGRLTTELASYGSENPCLIPPTGGYTGLENQLYRIEIHDGGKAGTATFKWSRDNASVETGLDHFVDANRKSLVVDSVGKDGVLRFNDGDWIEVLDDWCELNNQPGELHRIVVIGGVDDATRTITLDTAVSSTLFPCDANGYPANARNMRIRRWDQRGKVLRTDAAAPTVYTDLDQASSKGAIVVPNNGSVKIALENGIVVSFDVAPAGGVFKPGDWWVCAARTVDASIELLKQVPPRGIHHHYAKLGVYTPGAQPIDCRQFWPPASSAESCACTICVSPDAQKKDGVSLQQAINTVIANGGGTVCLEVGDYHLDAPLLISQANTLTLRGQGKASQLIVASTAIEIKDCRDLTLEAFSIRSMEESEQGGFAVISTEDVFGLTVEKLSITVESKNTDAAAITFARYLDDGTIRECEFKSPRGLVTVAADLAADKKPQTSKAWMLDNLIGEHEVTLTHKPAKKYAKSVKSASQKKVVAAMPEAGAAIIAELLIDNNRFACTDSAILLQLNAKSRPRIRVRNNFIIHCKLMAITVIGEGSSDEGIEICANRIDTLSLGISVGLNSSGIRILDNDIRCSATAGHAKAGVGILLWVQAVKAADTFNCQIAGNRISAFMTSGILITGAINSAQIFRNQISDCGAGIEVANIPSQSDFKLTEGDAMDENVGAYKPMMYSHPSMESGTSRWLGDRNVVVIENNQISEIDANRKEFGQSQLSAIRVLGVQTASITGNFIDSVGGQATAAQAMIFAVKIENCSRLRICDNELSNIGPVRPYLARVVGISVIAPDDIVVDNNLISGGADATSDLNSPWFAIDIGRKSTGDKTTDESGYAPVQKEYAQSKENPEIPAVHTERVETKTMSLEGKKKILMTMFGGRNRLLRVRASIRGNQISTPGLGTTIIVRISGSCDFSHNQCLCTGSPDDVREDAKTATVRIWSFSLIAGSNQISSASSLSMDMHPLEGPYTVLGNITMGEIQINNNLLAAPWESLNKYG